MIEIKEILFWISLIFSLVLLIWIIFGNTPTELIFLVTIYLTMLLKTWSISDRQIRTEGKLDRLKDGFIRLADDFKDLKKYIMKKG